jgi:hypothetical protein
MNYMPFIFLAIPLVFGSRAIYGRIKYGSWTGSFLGGSISRSVGEVQIAQSMGASQSVKVHAMKTGEPDGDFVGLVIVSKTMLGAGMQGYKLSKMQAQQLAMYLSQAAQ